VVFNLEILWFYIAVFLAISDEVHSRIMWGLFADFYILLAGVIKESVASNIRLWIVHEFMEALFHFVFLSIIFLSLEIGILAALIHMTVDLYHEFSGIELNPLGHRCLHFTIESIFFILIFAAGVPT
jgi:hypothetical protein